MAIWGLQIEGAETSGGGIHPANGLLGVLRELLVLGLAGFRRPVLVAQGWITIPWMKFGLTAAAGK